MRIQSATVIGCVALAVAAIVAGLFGVSARVALGPALAVGVDAGNLPYLAIGSLAAAGWLPDRCDRHDLTRVAGALLAMLAGGVPTLAIGAALAVVPGLSRTAALALPGIGGVAIAAVAVGWSGAGAPVPALPGWTGLPLLVAGPALAAFAGWQATHAAHLGLLARRIDRAQAGLVAAAWGAALAARGADQTALAAGALGGLLVLTASRAATAVLLARLAARIGAAAGSATLDRLGGLASAMPRTSAWAAIGAVTIAGIPLGGDFGGLWLLAQSMLGVGRIGGAVAEVAVAVGLLGLALAWTTRVTAVMRASLAFLGRPHTPRVSAAEERGRDLPAGATGAALLLLGVAPTWLWRLLRPHEALPPLLSGLPLPGLAIVLLVAAAVTVTLRARAADLRGGGRRLVPGWRDGATADPPWLPYGDPRTQAQAADLAAPAMAFRRLAPLPVAWLAGVPRSWAALATGGVIVAALLLADLA